MLVPKSVFAARKIADRECRRYALGGILFERSQHTKQPRAVATDGRRLVALTWPDDAADKESFILPDAACKESAAMMGKESTAVINAAGENNVEFTTSKAKVSHRQLKGRFPRWLDCIPAYTGDDISVDIDAEFLAECAEVLRTHAGSSENRAVTLTLKRHPDGGVDFGTPVLLTMARCDGHKAVAVIMSLGRGEENGKPVPIVPQFDIHKADKPEPAAAVLPEPQPSPVPAIAGPISADQPAEVVDAVAVVEHREPAVAESEIDTELEPAEESAAAAAAEIIPAELADKPPASPEPPPVQSTWHDRRRRAICAAYV